MSKPTKILIFIAFCGVVLISGIGHFFMKTPKPPLQLQSLRVGTVAEYSTLIQVAKRQGLFTQNGLDVSTVEYDSGAPSLNALLNGEIDLATASDFVGVSNSFEHQNFRIVASMFNSMDIFELIARKDHGIHQIADLKGKKIGLTKKTMGEFFLGIFLTSNNLPLKNITQLDGKSTDLENGIVEGSLDAVAIFHPHISDIEKKLGENSMKFFIQDKQLLHTLLYANTRVVQNQPDALRRFIAALVQAQQYAEQHPLEMKKFFKEQFHYDQDYIERVISHMNFQVTLSESMLLSLEDEARWSIEYRLTDKKNIPNYLDMIYFDALAKVRPEAISIFH